MEQDGRQNVEIARVCAFCHPHVHPNTARIKMLPITQNWPAACFNSTLFSFSPNTRSISESPIRWIPTSNRTRPARHRKVLSIIIMCVFLSLSSTRSLSAICGLPCTGCSCSGSCKTSSRHGRARHSAELMGEAFVLLHPL